MTATVEQIRDLAIAECESALQERDEYRDENIRLRMEIHQMLIESRYRQIQRRARSKRWGTAAVLYGATCMVITLWAVTR